ncbi:hypothetical protein BV25DRAFT_1574555 [Artomyces pyxidatus]|uniref:Uncharacterized protein n=1 Tax=Artomyces pyxidatus TaxID=48021 RepID=A0ACB8SK10_9AGAM|nr:hypothetical protein BV25DRAFT_1574555 [Artomyces pyxidatus]
MTRTTRASQRPSVRTMAPYARIETPSIASPSVAHPSPAPSAVSRPPSVAPPSSSYFPDRPNTNANSAVELHRPPSNAPTQLLSPASTSSDAVLQAALQQLMHSPGQMQRFMQALSGTSPAAHNQAAGAVQPQSASIEAPAPLSSIPSFLQYMPGPSTPSQPQQPPSQVAIYTPPPDIPNIPNPSPTSFLNSSSMIDFPPLLTTSSDEDDALAAGVALQEARLHQTFANTNEIDAALDGVHESIDSIVRKLGLDSSALSQEADAGAYNMSGAQTPEFDFDALLHEFTSPDHDAGGGGGGFDTNGTVQFLDDAVHTLPQKRTSDVAELGLEGRTKKSKK